MKENITMNPAASVPPTIKDLSMVFGDAKKVLSVNTGSKKGYDSIPCKMADPWIAVQLDRFRYCCCSLFFVKELTEPREFRLNIINGFTYLERSHNHKIHASLE